MKMHELQAIGMKHTDGVTECVAAMNADDQLCTCALGAQLYGYIALDTGINNANDSWQSFQYQVEFFSFYDKLNWDNLHQALDYLCEARPRLRLIKHHIEQLKYTNSSEYWERNTFTLLNDFRVNMGGITISREKPRRLLVLALLRWLDI